MLLDYGKCPDEPCQNGARCAKRGSKPTDYFCECPDGFIGRYCESEEEDLFPLIILPIFLGVLFLLLFLLCCCICCRGTAGEQVSSSTPTHHQGGSLLSSKSGPHTLSGGLAAP